MVTEELTEQHQGKHHPGVMTEFKENPPFVEQSETLAGVEVVQLVVIIHHGVFDLLPAPQHQEQLVSAHHVELVI